jgi:hypothetical protein
MSIKECRICYEDETETQKQFIQPCQCKGSSANVHAECLDKWRQTNRARLAFLQCQECHIYYNIGYEYPIERYKFPTYIPIDTNQVGNHMMFALCWLTIPIIIMSQDSNYAFVRATYIGSDPDNLITYLQKVVAREEGIIAYCYYYAFVIFVSVTLLQLAIGRKVHTCIVNKQRYWKKAIVPYLAVLLFNMHFLYLYSFTFDAHYSPWLLISGCFSLFSYEIVAIYCYAHNYIIDVLNRENNDCVLNYCEELSLEITQPRYRQNVVLQINNVLNDGQEESFESSDDSATRDSRAGSGSSSISFSSISSISTELL